jgi:hypothetical protein
MKKLNLAQTQITYSELLDVTDSCQELEELNISECWALNEDRLVLAELFQDGLQQLRVLDASGLQVQKDFQFMANQGYYMVSLIRIKIAIGDFGMFNECPKELIFMVPNSLF